MRRTIITLVVIVCGLAVGAASAGASGSFSNCTAIHAKYPPRHREGRRSRQDDGRAGDEQAAESIAVPKGRGSRTPSLFPA
jgi:hypothetical protein